MCLDGLDPKALGGVLPHPHNSAGDIVDPGCLSLVEFPDGSEFSCCLKTETLASCVKPTSLMNLLTVRGQSAVDEPTVDKP